MFAKFARFISRHWIAVLVAWVIIPAVLFHFAPKWDEITHDGDFAYLPATMTSVRGEELLAKTFPDMTAKSNMVLVVARPDRELSDDDKAIAIRLADMFTPKPGEKMVASVMTPDDPFVGSKLQSPDGRSELAGLAVVQRVHGRRQHDVHQAGLRQGAGDAEGPGLSRGPAIGGDGLGAGRHRHALFDEREHRQHGTGDDSFW